MIYQGFGWGVGSSLGRAATSAMLGGSGYATEAAPANASTTTASEAGSPAGACANAAKAFGECVSRHADDVGRCQAYADLLTSCKRGELA